MVPSPPLSVRDVRRTKNRRKHLSWASRVHHFLQIWLWPEDWHLWHTEEDFLIPCPAFRCSLICRLYFYLPSPPTPGLSAFTRLLMSIRRGTGCLGTPAAPIRGLSAGDWACCPPLAPQAFFPSTFLRFAPDAASLHASLHPSFPSCLPSSSVFSPLSRAHGAPQGVRGSERPSVAWGLALVPGLYFKEKLTGAPFRRQPHYNCWRH